MGGTMSPGRLSCWARSAAGASTLVGVLVGLAGWAVTRDDELDLAWWPVGAALAAGAVGMAFTARAWKWAFVLCAGMVCGALLAMIPGWVDGSTSNNLWPMALTLIFGISVLPALAGACSGALVRRVVERLR
jgi:uncharacterized membrane protein YhhN